MYVSGCEVKLINSNRPSVQFPATSGLVTLFESSSVSCDPLVPHLMINLKNLVVMVLLKALGLGPHCHGLPVGNLEKDA